MIKGTRAPQLVVSIPVIILTSMTVIGSACIGKREFFVHTDTPLAAAGPKGPSSSQHRDEGVSQPKPTPY